MVGSGRAASGSLGCDEVTQAVVFLAAGGAALEWARRPGKSLRSGFAGEFEFDVAVEFLEAVIAADFGFCGAEEPARVFALDQFVPWSVLLLRAVRV